MPVTRLDKHQRREIVAALEDLLSRAKAGRLRGLAFAVKTGPKRHRTGFVGDYWDDPVEALGCVTRMAYKVNQLISSRDDDPETSAMPL